jgi:hypothetical protein
MPNPQMPRVNTKSFNPDKGLPLIGVRPGQAVGKGAAEAACKNYQISPNAVKHTAKDDD